MVADQRNHEESKNMTEKVNNSDCKKCRRAGEKLFLKGDRCNSPKCALVKRNFPPGSDGSTRMQKLTPYGMQLKEKQKTKRIYGLREKQFRNYFDEAFKKVGNTGELLFAMLESRLDNTAFRLGFAASRSKARQIVSHGHIQVNGKKVDIPSYRVKMGDMISIREKSLKMPVFAELSQSLENKDMSVPWLALDIKQLEGKIAGVPKLGDVEMNIDWQTIVEFYSK